MKKILLAVFVFTFTSSLCFAQQVSAPVVQTAQTTQAVQTPAVVKTFTGKVDSLTIGDATSGTKSELVVVDDNGKKISFFVKNGTPITDKDEMTITLSDIKKDNKVTVEYKIKASGKNKAQSIKILE
jgi:hypothetical protein